MEIIITSAIRFVKEFTKESINTLNNPSYPDLQKPLYLQIYIHIHKRFADLASLVSLEAFIRCPPPVGRRRRLALTRRIQDR